MRRTLVSTAFALALGISACGPAGQPHSGVQGLVQVGPTCPVERLGSPCPPRPLAATVVARDGNGQEVGRAQSGADGHFTIGLQPGAYTLVGLTINASGLPRPIPTTVTVVEGRYTSVTVEYDSGIR